MLDYRLTAACAVIQAACVTAIAAVVHHRTGLVCTDLTVGYGNAGLLAFASFGSRRQAVKSAGAR